MLPGGTIEITVHAAHDDVTVANSGLGIPAADLPYVFDEFYRVAIKETENIKGTGLGLAIAKGVVEVHVGILGWRASQDRAANLPLRCRFLL